MSSSQTAGGGQIVTLTTYSRAETDRSLYNIQHGGRGINRF